MLDAFKNMGVNMSLKIHLLDSHLDFFPPNLGAFSDKHGELFHQVMKNVEKRYAGSVTRERMLADYCWRIKREKDTPGEEQW